ncbi:hypothetical protein MUP32_01510 [Candidatus Microgenomates bacterium]|nr:hypothetical protein [Candidatus Microgenomates bacterium]
MDEAKKHALTWAKDAQIYRFNVSLDQDDVLPSYYYTFFSPTDSEMEFKVSKSGNKPLETKTGKIYVKREKIPQFPSKITSLEASDLSLKNWEKIRGSEEKINSIALDIEEEENYWDVELKSTGAVKNIKTTDCKVYFDKKTECLRRRPTPTTNPIEATSSAQVQPQSVFETGFTFFKDIETGEDYQEAKKRALATDSRAKLCAFYLSLYRTPQDLPYYSFIFCLSQKEKLFEADYLSYGKIDYHPAKNTDNYQKEISPYPPKITAQEAAIKSYEQFKKIKEDGFSLTSLSLSLRDNFDYWSINFFLKDKDGVYKNQYCKLFFDQKMECGEIK